MCGCSQQIFLLNTVFLFQKGMDPLNERHSAQFKTKEDDLLFTIICNDAAYVDILPFLYLCVLITGERKGKRKKLRSRVDTAFRCAYFKHDYILQLFL